MKFRAENLIKIGQVYKVNLSYCICYFQPTRYHYRDDNDKNSKNGYWGNYTTHTKYITKLNDLKDSGWLEFRYFKPENKIELL